MKLHALYTKVSKRSEEQTRQAIFAILLNKSETEGRLQHRQNIRRTFQERQTFAMSLKPPRSGSQGMPSRIPSAANISQSVGDTSDMSARMLRSNIGSGVPINVTMSSSSL